MELGFGYMIQPKPKPKPKPKSKSQSKVKIRTQVKKVHQVKIENRRFSFKQQYFQVVLRQSLPKIMVYVQFTTRRITQSNHRTIDSFNNRNLESDNKSVKIKHFRFIMLNCVCVAVLSCVVYIPSISVSTSQVIQKKYGNSTTTEIISTPQRNIS